MNRISRVMSLILANLRNKPGRNIATAFCFAFIAANIFSAQFLIAGTVGSVDQGISRMGADILVIPNEYLLSYKETGSRNTEALIGIKPSDYRLRDSLLESIRKTDGVVAMSPQLYVTTATVPQSPVPVHIYGFDPATDFTILPWLTRPLSRAIGPKEVIVGHSIPGDLSSDVVISGHRYTIAGRLEETKSLVDNSIYLTMPDAYEFAGSAKDLPSAARISPGDISGVMVKVAPGADADMTGAIIRQPVSGVSYLSRHFSLNPVSRDVSGVTDILHGISAIVVIASLPLVALISAMVAHEREREIGLLKAMGAKKPFVYTVVMGESLALSVIGGIIGVGVSFVAFVVLNPGTLLGGIIPVTFRMPGMAPIGVMAGTALLVVIAIGSLAALWPAYRSATLNPYDAIRSGE